MITKEVKVDFGQEAEVRPVAMLVQLASKFDSYIYLEKANRSINAKSIMGMMTFGFVTGETITISTAGSDEEEAMESLASFLSGNN